MPLSLRREGSSSLGVSSDDPLLAYCGVVEVLDFLDVRRRRVVISGFDSLSVVVSWDGLSAPVLDLRALPEFESKEVGIVSRKLVMNAKEPHATSKHKSLFVSEPIKKSVSKVG